MGNKIFAAIDVGSFELAMKIYEFSSGKGIREIDNIRHRLALGHDSYNTGKIGLDKIDELCRVLREFKGIMKEYHVSDFKAYGTSALRETENTLIILDEIKNRTGIDIEVLSNSEQRFLDYKSIASRGDEFKHIIEDGTAIIDIGGGNIQMSLFDNDTLVSTQALKLGVLRIYDSLDKMRVSPIQMQLLLSDMIDGQLMQYKKLYMKEREIVNLIVMDEYVSPVIHAGIFEKDSKGIISARDFLDFAERLFTSSLDSIAEMYGMPYENIPLLLISSSIIKHTILLCDVANIWIPGTTICDGIAYEYAENNKMKLISHDFEKDILASAVNISKRYMGSKKRSDTLEEISLEIFDAMKKLHGMGNKERFLLRLAAILHDCGKFINMINVGECSYNIIMNTEIIGLSHQEREMVAYIVKFNHDKFIYYEQLSHSSSLDKEAYLVIAKLSAILRIAGGLDKSHKQKMRKIKAAIKDDKLEITFTGPQNIMYEQSSFDKKASFFREVFNIEPVIIHKREIV